MEYQGQTGHATDKVEKYGQPVAGHGGATGGPTGTHGAAAAAGTGQLQPTRDDHKTDAVLRRSGSSSSSSSEDDGVGGRRKKGMKEKIKEKLPGGAHKDATGQQHTPAAGEYAGTGTGTHGAEATGTGTGTHGAEATGEKKGVMEKIKEKLPGGQH